MELIRTPLEWRLWIEENVGLAGYERPPVFPCYCYFVADYVPAYLTPLDMLEKLVELYNESKALASIAAATATATVNSEGGHGDSSAAH